MSFRKNLENISEYFPTEESIDRLEEHFPIMDKVFGADNWDLHLKLKVLSHRQLNAKTFSIETTSDIIRRSDTYDRVNHRFIIEHMAFVVRFDEIEVSNSKNRKETVTDLYMYINMDLHVSNFNYVFSGISGTRGTYTYPHFCANYTHSHLPQLDRDHPSISGFCTGSGQPIDVIQAKMNINPMTYPMTQFQMYCLQVKDAAGWESLEGTPYKRMNVIANSSRDAARINAPTFTRLKNIYEQIENRLHRSSASQLKFKLVGNKINLEENEDFNNFVKSYCNGIETVYYFRGRYLSKVNNTADNKRQFALINARKRIIGYFDGKPIIFQITKSEDEELDMSDFITVPNPHITAYVKRKLEERIQRNYAKSYIASEGVEASSISNSGKPMLRSNQKSLQHG